MEKVLWWLWVGSGLKRFVEVWKRVREEVVSEDAGAVADEIAWCGVEG